ncbi:MAG: FAD:protein FMN transferase [Lachnospiraceae bacterium]|nr:FAD:protein FMN transferase [Lachnospiraceae bacterium]
MQKRTEIRFILILTLLVLPVISCGRKNESTVSRTGYFFDTVVTLKLTAENADSLADEIFDMCAGYEDIFSAKKEGSELWEIDHRSSNTLQVSDEMAELIQRGLYYNELSGGAFSITSLPLSELWSVTSDDPHVPDGSLIAAALESVDDSRVHIEGNVLSFESDDTKIDLGAITKGYISMKICGFLKERGCTSACINLGGNVSLVGGREDGKEWNIGLQRPFAARGELLTSVKKKDGCVISAGCYERYFEADGRLYHHIMDPATGYPAESGLNMVTVIGDDDVEGDALSTIGMVLGKEAFTELLSENEIDVRVIFADNENEISYYPE